LASSPALLVRVATTDDGPIIAKLFTRLTKPLELHRGGQSYLAFSALRQAIHESSTEQLSAILLCFKGTEAIALASCRIDEAFGVRYCSLELLLPDPPEVLTGIVELLILTAEDFARLHGATALDIASLPGDQKTKSALEERGFKARLLVMHRSLEGPSS
jgi:hypothetical protein